MTFGEDDLGDPDREMLYLVSLYTGLRASELASLTQESFALERDPPTLTVAAGYSKRRREDVVPHPAAGDRGKIDRNRDGCAIGCAL